MVEVRSYRANSKAATCCCFATTPGAVCAAPSSVGLYCMAPPVHAHVGVCWSDHGRVWVMDMTTRGCAPRLLSTAGDFDWAPAPKALGETALAYAFEHFGELEYSRLRAIGGQLGLIDVRSEHESMCAEYALAIWKRAGMPPPTRHACVVRGWGNDRLGCADLRCRERR